MADFIRPTPRNPFLGLLADAATKARDATGPVGDFLLGGAPETLDNASYGVSPVRLGETRNGLMGAINGMQVDTGVADIAGLLSGVPGVVRGGQFVGREALRAVDDAMMDGGHGLLSAARPQFAVEPAATALPMDEASRAARMQQMGLERGWYRGGPAPAGGRRTGPWYTQDVNEAADYSRRFGDKADVREYAIPRGPYLDAGMSYNNTLPLAMAKVVNTPEFGAKGAQLAKEFGTFGPDERISGGALWQALESRFGNDGAAEAVSRLGAFRGARGMTGPSEAYVFKSSPVRDAESAAFDPARSAEDYIYGAADPRLLGLLSIGALGLAPSQSR